MRLQQNMASGRTVLKKGEKGRKYWSCVDDLRTYVNTKRRCRSNPGPAGYGYVISGSVGQIIEERFDPVEWGTPSEAEYLGVIAGLKRAADLGARKVTLLSNNKLVIGQIRGKSDIESLRLAGLWVKAKEQIKRFEDFDCKFVRRKKNSIARGLAKKAVKKLARKAKNPLDLPLSIGYTAIIGQGHWTERK